MKNARLALLLCLISHSLLFGESVPALFKPARLNFGVPIMFQKLEDDTSNAGGGAQLDAIYTGELFLRWRIFSVEAFEYPERVDIETTQLDFEFSAGGAIHLPPLLFCPYMGIGGYFLDFEAKELTYITSIDADTDVYFDSLDYRSAYLRFGMYFELFITPKFSIGLDISLALLLGGEVKFRSSIFDIPTGTWWKITIKDDLKPAPGVRIRIPFYFVLDDNPNGAAFLLTFTFHYEFLTLDTKDSIDMEEVHNFRFVFGLEIRV